MKCWAASCACRTLLATYRAKLEHGYFEAFRPRTQDQATAEQAAKLESLAKGQEQLQNMLLALLQQRMPGQQQGSEPPAAICSVAAVQAAQMSDEDWGCGLQAAGFEGKAPLAHAIHPGQV